MLKKILLSLIICSLVFIDGKIVLAESESSNVIIQDTTQESVNIDNKICPVSGDKIVEETKATVEYQGKIYNLCCAGCIEEFRSDPKKYIQKVEEEQKNNK